MSVCVVIKDFRTLKVWQKANSLEHEIGKLVKGFPNHEQYRLVDQIIRSSRSISANIAAVSYTHLATAIGVEACRKGYNVKFFRTAALVNRLVEARKGGELSGLLKQLTKADLLICDEWGYVPVDREGAQLLFQVIADCYEQRSIIITTNLEFSRWMSCLLYTSRCV